MTYAVIGTGAIGGYYGGRLAHAGHIVHFLAHSDYAEMSQRLTVDSCDGDFVVDHPHVYADTADMPPVDVVIVALKTTNNHLLPGLLAPLLKHDPVVLLIQNGLCVEADLAAAIPDIRLAAGLAFICSNKAAPAHIAHLDYGKLTLADYSCGSEAVAAIAADFATAGVATDIVEYHFGRWRKAIWNLPFNGMTVLTGRDTLELVGDPETLAWVRQIMREVVDIANALGVSELTDAHIERNIADTMTMRPYWPSMYVDYTHHRPLEVHYLYTRAIDEARRLSVACPHLQEMERALRSVAPYRPGTQHGA